MNPVFRIIGAFLNKPNLIILPFYGWLLKMSETVWLKTDVKSENASLAKDPLNLIKQ